MIAGLSTPASHASYHLFRAKRRSAAATAVYLIVGAALLSLSAVAALVAHTVETAWGIAPWWLLATTVVWLALGGLGLYALQRRCTHWLQRYHQQLHQRLNAIASPTSAGRLARDPIAQGRARYRLAAQALHQERTPTPAPASQDYEVRAAVSGHFRTPEEARRALYLREQLQAPAPRDANAVWDVHAFFDQFRPPAARRPAPTRQGLGQRLLLWLAHRPPMAR